MTNFNRVILVGRLAKDPERKHTKAGKEFSTFALGTNKKMGEEEKVTWHNCVIWNEVTARYVNDFACRATLLLVEGAIESRTYTKNDGSIGYATDIVIDQYNGTAQILSDGVGRGLNEAKRTDDPSARKKNAYTKASREEETPSTEDRLDDEIPF